MPPRRKLPSIGKAKKNRFNGAETWTVVYADQNVGLNVGDRVRIEDRVGRDNSTLFPDTNTALFNHSQEIELRRTKNDSEAGLTFEFDGLLNGKPTTLWLQEGGTRNAEAEIWEQDPNIAGGGGGIAGIRR